MIKKKKNEKCNKIITLYRIELTGVYLNNEYIYL